MSLPQRLLPATLLVSTLFLQAPIAQAQSCEAINVVELTKRLDQARNRIYLVKYDDVKTRLEAIEGVLSCVTEVIPRDVLSRIYLYRGVVAFNQGDEAAASAAFRQAVTVDRSSRWDERFGQRPREIFIEAKEAVLLAPKEAVKIPEVVAGVLVYIDSEPYDGGSSVQLAPGEHFMQLRGTDGSLTGTLFRVTGSGGTVLPIPENLVVKKAPAVVQKPENPPRNDDRGNSSTRKPGASEPKPPKAPPKPFDKTKLRPVSYAFMGLGGASLLTGLTGGAMFWQTRDQLLSEYYSNRPDANKEALLERNKTAALLANVGLGGALVLGGAGAGLFLLSAPPSPQDLLSVVPWLETDVKGLVIQGRF